MRDITIFGKFTVIETLMVNGVHVDKGFDEMLNICYRANLNKKNSAVDVFIECYFRNITDLKEYYDMY